MKTIRKLSFFGILVVMVAVLFLVGISFMQAQAKTLEKPDKPPGLDKKEPEEEATWAAVLPNSSMMLYGDGETYENNGTDIIVKMERMQSKVRGKIFYTYYFCFKLVNINRPGLPNRYAGFKDVTFSDEIKYSEPCCYFPGDNCSYPDCMLCFLNQTHPGAESDYFYLKFWISELSLPGRTLEDMTPGVEYLLNSGNNRIKFRIQNTEDFINPETEYHNIDSDEITWGEYALNAWITKMDGNTWRISINDQALLVQETYTIRTHPVRPITENVVPLEAWGNFTFWIDFIKKTTTQ